MLKILVKIWSFEWMIVKEQSGQVYFHPDNLNAGLVYTLIIIKIEKWLCNINEVTEII